MRAGRCLPPGVIIDPGDAERVARYCWVIGKRGYPSTAVRLGPKRKRLLLHHYLIGTPRKGFEVDHVNGDRLDNRKANLRVCTHAENCRNQPLRKNNISGATGVRYLANTGKWHARISIMYKETHLGCFDTKEAAIEARRAAERRLYGRFAPSTSRESA